MTATNRRKHPRIEAEGLAGHLKHDQEVVLGLGVENVSLGGALLRCNTPLPVGTPVQIELARPGMKSIKLVGRVIGEAPVKRPSTKRGTRGMRIRFNPASAEMTSRLDELVHTLYFPSRATPVPSDAPPPQAGDFEFGRDATGAALAAPVGKGGGGSATPAPLAPAPVQFDTSQKHGEFDFSFSQPLAETAQEPVPVEVPAAAKLTASLKSQEATLSDLRFLISEQDKEITALRDELRAKNEQLDKLRRAVLELRHRLKPLP